MVKGAALISCWCFWALLPCGAQSISSGWRVVKDKKETCQIAVPAEWTGDSLLKSVVTAPQKRGGAVVHGLRAGQAFPDAIAVAKIVDSLGAAK